MKATLENFLVKWDGENPLWKEFIEWLDKTTPLEVTGVHEDDYYGIINNTDERRFYKREITDTPIITLEQWKELINKTNNMKTEFKKGDRVFIHNLGWCEYFTQNEDYESTLYKDNEFYKVSNEFISFTEYRLEGFSQERPFEPEIGKFYWFWDDFHKENNFCVYGLLTAIRENADCKYKAGRTASYFKHISETNPLHDSE